MNVAIYARVSSDKQDVDLSLTAQLKALREFAAKNGHTVVREYVDEAESGRTVNRPTFQEMIREARQKPPPFEGILVWKLSRFARNREDSIIYKSLLRKLGVQVVSISEPIDNSPTGQMLEGIIEVMDEFYSKNLAQDVVRGMREAVSRGFSVSSGAPYGFRRVQVNDGGKMRAKLEPDEARAPVIRRIYDDACHCLGVKEIASRLNQDGVASPKGGRWGKATVYKILTNEIYAGTLVWGASGTYHGAAGLKPLRVENAVTPLVSMELFRQVQGLLHSRSPKVIAPRRVTSQYLLSGILKCGQCGASMFGVGAKSGQFHYYVCSTAYRQGSKVCGERPVRRERMDDFAIAKIVPAVLRDENITRIVDILNEEKAQESATATDRVNTFEHELNGVAQRLERLYEALETGLVKLADLAPRIQELRIRQNALTTAKTEAAGQAVAGPKASLDRQRVIAYARDLKRLLSIGTVAERRTVMQWFVEEIRKQEPQVTVRYRVPVPEHETGEVLPGVLESVRVGGAEGTRTPYLFNAIEALSQLSYSPIFQRRP